jgi:diguanylate cyclase (GGDEF)-like protein
MSKIKIQKMDKDEITRQRKYKLMRIFLSLVFLIHIAFIVLFIYLQLYYILALVIFNICLIIFNWFLLKKKKFLSSMQLTITGLIIGATVHTYFLGWESYFGFYLLALAIVIINSISLQLKWKIFEVTLIMGLFITMLIITKDGFRVYAIKSKILEIIRFFNIITISFSIFLMQFSNFNENEILKKKLESLSEIDVLTGAYNRLFFNNYLDIEIKRHASHMKYGHKKESNFGVAMIDIDNFKDINDTYGHLTGDIILAETANIMQSILFERDIFCRYGGEEFVILFTNTARPGAMLAIEKIRKTIEDHTFTINNKPLPNNITVSIGFASFDEESDIYTLLNIADKRLYEAKKKGKNRIVSR